MLSLLHSHIGQFSQEYPKWIWPRVVDFVQTWNQDAGTITPEKLPDDLKEAFRRPAVARIPEELTTHQAVPAKVEWSQHAYADHLALANLAGAWNEKSEADIAIMSALTAEEYPAWVAEARAMLQVSDGPFSLRNGVWRITERANLWVSLGPRVFDQHLDTFRETAVAVLTERDPSFELPTDERYAASIHGKTLSHSPALRMGLADGLAILGSKPDALVNCSQGKAEATAVLSVRAILADADWVLWGSLESVLPALAEAAPNEFLVAVDKALRLSSCPFDELFSQEGSGITGRNYLTGLLWALERLAWDEKHLVPVCVALGELASHDPGGQWANRPADSLATILLPWLPQTIAPIDKRKVAVQTLCREWPASAWRLILSLLPNQHQVSTGAQKPSWRDTIPDTWKEGATTSEYWDQISFYADLAVSMADHDAVKLAELAHHLGDLPKPSFDRALEALSSDEISGLSEEQRLPLWDSLVKLTSRHRRFAGAKWAWHDELLSPIEKVADALAPSSPSNSHKHLFSNRRFDLREENGTWEEQEKKLDDRCQKAVQEILGLGGIQAVIDFADGVESPSLVGYFLGRIADAEIDHALLPQHLCSENRELLSFAGGYVRGCHAEKGWPWADDLDKSAWTTEQVGQFLAFLPFSQEAWTRAAQLLSDAEGEYWSRTDANPYRTDAVLDPAIDKLIEYGRPHAAVVCLGRMRHASRPIDVAQAIRALLAALSSNEPSHAMDEYQTVELIRFLQTSPEVSANDLFHVEWSYLALLDHDHGAEPRLLESRLASDPDFFSEVIRLIYRSRKIDAAPSKPSEDSEAIATNAWRLLHRWQTPPGSRDDGSFDDAAFLSWIQDVKKTCGESGHLEVALVHAGEVLIHCPPDATGLWINRSVASALNAKDAEDMRTGFSTGILNSRGVHWVDPTGKPELALADQYRRKAEDAEDAGYQRLAVTLRSVSETYAAEAKRIVDEHEDEDYDDAE